MKVDGSVAADALKNLNSKALKKKDANAAKATGGKKCGH